MAIDPVTLEVYAYVQRIAAERAPTVADVEAAWTQIRARLGRALGQLEAAGAGEAARR